MPTHLSKYSLGFRSDDTIFGISSLWPVRLVQVVSTRETQCALAHEYRSDWK
jgi:hypothetical protein